MIAFSRWVLAVILILGASRCEAADEAGKPAPKLRISETEQKILALTNQARQREKLPPLKPNAILFQVARAHSANMANKGEMKHELDGKNLVDRVNEAGYDYRSVGENIAAGQGWSLDEVFQAWMDSPQHRDNILKASYEEIGIGIARDGKGEVYFTQVFGAQRKKK